VCGAQGGICRVNTFFQSRSLLFSLQSQTLIGPPTVTPRLAAISHQPHSLRFTDLLPNENSCISLVAPNHPGYKISARTTKKTHVPLLLYHCCVCVCCGSHVIVTQPVHWRADGCLATAVCLVYFAAVA
jgi:hypothetical protein